MEFNTCIDQIHHSDLSKKTFEDRFMKTKTPVLIKGLLDEHPAKNWSLDSLEQELGHFPVKVFDNQRKNGTSYLFGDHSVPMKHMIDLIRENKSSDLRMFVNPILKKNKKLASEIPCPPYFNCSLQLPNLMFIGGKGTLVPLHYDFMYDDGLLTQFFGRKEVLLLEPSQSDLLYRLPFNSNSLVNLFEPNFEIFPALKYVKGYRILLEHGDTLYIPSGFWHQMIYTDASLSIGFRKWNKDPLLTLKTAALRISQITFDKSMSALVGKKWLEWKKNQTWQKSNSKVPKITEKHQWIP